MSFYNVLSNPYNVGLKLWLQSKAPVGMDVNLLSFGDPYKLAAGIVRVPVAVPSDAYDVAGWQWHGGTTIQHRTFDLGALQPFFQLSDLPQKPDGELTAEDVVDFLGTRFGLHFELSEYASGPIVDTDGSYYFTPTNSSLRYHGKLLVVLGIDKL